MGEVRGGREGGEERGEERKGRGREGRRGEGRKEREGTPKGWFTPPICSKS